jgi:integron integrase
MTEVLASPPSTGPPKLLDRVRSAIRARHYSRRTEEAYVPWVRRYILFHGKRHPDQMGAIEVAAFLSSLATDRHVSASTQNQALSALLFLYRHVLGQELGTLPAVPRAKRPARLPVVLNRPEVAAVIGKLTGVTKIVGLLLYGAGLRLGECLELRVKDLDFDIGQITIRRGKGQKDRVTMLPGTGRELLRQHLESVRATHAGDLAQGVGRVVLPDALARKYPGAATEWGWQFVFPAARICRDPRWGAPSRFHLHESAVQRAVGEAARRAGVAKHVGPHTFRHYAGSRTMPSRLAIQPCFSSDHR